MIQKVNFEQGDMELPSSEKSHIAIVIEYNDSKSYAIYLDVPVSQAKQRFTERMNARTSFEIEHEGWNARISQISISDEIHICGDWNSQIANTIRSFEKQ